MAVGSAKPQGKPRPLYGEQASRRVLAHLLAEFERARDERDAAQARMNQFADTIRLFIGNLSAEERTEFTRRFDDARRGSPARGGETYGNVVALFRRDQRPEWTLAEAKIALQQNGVKVEDKTLQNVFVYLANTGRLQRVSRGRYVVTGLGIGIESSDELARDDGTQRVSEHDA